MSPLNGYLRPVSSEAALAISKSAALYASEVEPLKVYPEFLYTEMRELVQVLSRMLETRRLMLAEEVKLSALATGQENEIIDIINS